MGFPRHRRVADAERPGEGTEQDIAAEPGQQKDKRAAVAEHARKRQSRDKVSALAADQGISAGPERRIRLERKAHRGRNRARNCCRGADDRLKPERVNEEESGGASYSREDEK